MFTIKLRRGNVTKLVAATTIVIYPAGKPEPEDTNEVPPAPVAMTNKIREISIKTPGGRKQAFYVGEEASGTTSDQELWDYAFIENAHGSTTERVYAD